MKILFCDNSLKELINFRGDIISHFADEGHNIVLVAPINMEIPDNTNFKVISTKLERGGMNPFKDIAYLSSLYRIFRKEKPDYIFNYTIKPNIYGSIVAKLLNIPSSSMVAGLGYVFNHNDLRSKIARILYKFALNLNQKVLVLNSGNLAKLLSTKTLKQEKAVLLPGGEGINLSRYK